MLPRNHPDGIHIAFDDHRLVNNAGLILPATLALHVGLPQLVDRRLDLGDAPGRANPSDKISTLVASALAGGDCIDDADVLRTGRTACALGCIVKAPSTLGTFLRSFRWGHVRQLDRVSRELLARAWAARSLVGKPFAGFRAKLYQTYHSLIVHNNKCNTLSSLSIISIIDVKKMTAWRESGFPARFLGAMTRYRECPRAG